MVEKRVTLMVDMMGILLVALMVAKTVAQWVEQRENA